jgi:hypothetical protein
MAYEPRGKVKDLADAMVADADPRRVWEQAEVAKVLGVPNYSSTVLQYTDSAFRNGVLFRRLVGGSCQFRLIPFDDPSAPAGPALESTANGWKPPQMVAPRGQAAPALDLGKRTTSAATASGHEIPDSASTPEPVEAAGPGQERHHNADQQPAGAGEGCGEVANEGDARVASGGRAQLDEEEPAQVFNACLWLDGDLDLYGLDELQDGGGHRLKAGDVLKLRRLLAWMPV